MPEGMDRAVPVPASPAFIPAAISDGKVDERDGLSSPRVAELVAAARQGDRESFAELYRIHHPILFRMARFNVGSAAEDVVAEVFVRAWKGLGRYRDRGRPFVAWLYGIARHVVADEFRRRKALPLSSVPEGPDGRAEQDDRLLLALCLEKLPRDQRRVVEMKFLLGLRNQEVAAALGRSVGAVNALQWRALRALQGLMEAR